MRQHARLVVPVVVFVLFAWGCGGGGGGGGQATPGAVTSVEALRAFGFGQAVISPREPDGRDREDVAVVVGFLAERATAANFSVFALGDAANVAYVIVPNAIQTDQVNRPGALTAEKYNTWLPSGLQITNADIGRVYPNDQVFSFLRLDLESTRSKMSALLSAMLAGTGRLDGFYIDLLDSSVAYPAQLTALLRQLKQSERAAGRKEPVIATNLASLKTYFEKRYFDADASDVTTLPATFDLVLTEEYGNPRFSFPDKSPEDVIPFHERYPAIKIIVNVRFKMNTFSEAYVPNNPDLPADTPCAPPFTDPRDVDHARVWEAVTLAALVGGLHAVDDGTQCHGQNTYARMFLQFPVLRPGLPIAPLENNPQFYRRDYARMIAVYAKTAGAVVLPPGDWKNFWDDQGRGGTFRDAAPISPRSPYLFFKQ